MLMGTLIWALMPLAIALGANVSDGIGFLYVNNRAQIVVTESMLVWLAPLSLVTTIVGLFVYWGRALTVGLGLALAWMVLGIASASGLFVIAALVAYAIFTGRRRLLA